MVFKTLKELDNSEGTVQLVDIAQGGNTLLHLEGSSILLVPQPSSDPNDPLRWSSWKKNIIFINICTYSFLNNCFIGGIASAFYTLSQEYVAEAPEIANLLVYTILVLGLGNFVMVPLSIYLGKRPVFLFASTVLFVCSLWSAVAKSYNSLFAARLVASVAGSATEALSAAFVNDLFFLHERGHKMMIYVIFLASGNSVGPLVSGFVVASLSWVWFCWILTIFCGISLISVFFFVPETRHSRNYNLSQVSVDTEKSSTDGMEKQATSQVEAIPAASVYSENTTPKSYVATLSPWSGISPGANLFSIFIRPFPLFLYPAVFWGFLSYSVSLAWVIAVGTLYTFVLQVPPYNFSAGIAGLINVPTLIGFVVGAYSGGYLTDVYAAYRARKRGGVFMPEDRLVLLIIPSICVPVGCLVFGFGAGRQLHWAVMFVGYGFLSVGLTGVASIGMTYVLDSYYPVAAEALLLVNGLKNVVAYGFLHGVLPWVGAAGYERSFGTMAGIFLAIMALAIPLYVWGPRIGHYTSTHLRVISW